MSVLLETFEAALSSIKSLHDLNQLKAAYLGKKGLLTESLKELAQLPIEEKKARGQEINTLKQVIEFQLKEHETFLQEQEQLAQLRKQVPDASLPARHYYKGGLHPLSQIKQELISIFMQRGFDCGSGPDLEDDFHNFEALNIPSDHPARLMHDSFYLEDGRVLRTHTSPVQIRYLKNHRPPIRMIAPGRVYRCDFDPTHSPMFHQIEGLVIDQKTNLTELREVLQSALNQFFGKTLPMRFRPSYFPFTEPSIEVDIGCVACDGKGCGLCKHSGWLEVLGCGMVHPEVLSKAGLDPNIYQGYAFGMGVERLAMLKLHIPDLRLFFENQLDFLKQF